MVRLVERSGREGGQHGAAVFQKGEELPAGGGAQAVAFRQDDERGAAEVPRSKILVEHQLGGPVQVERHLVEAGRVVAEGGPAAGGRGGALGGTAVVDGDFGQRDRFRREPGRHSLQPGQHRGRVGAAFLDRNERAGRGGQVQRQADVLGAHHRREGEIQLARASMGGGALGCALPEEEVACREAVRSVGKRTADALRNDLAAGDKAAELGRAFR